MLRSLSVKNFAVIDELSLDFSPGLNVFTGETGAGKSILIEALGFLLGARGSSTWLRAGAPKLEVTGSFDKDDFPKDIRAQFKIVDSPVMVRRELDAGGKTRAIINSQSAPLALLSSWGDGLVDFHGQHEHQTLLKPAVQLDLLDRFGELDALLEETAQAYSRWTALCAERDSGQLSEEERLKRIDMNRFQLQEINEVNPKLGEEEELESALPLLKNAERLKGFAGSAYELLYEQEGSVQGDLLKVERALSELAKLDASMEGALRAVETARLAIEDVTHSLGDYRDHVELNPDRLDSILSRQDAISRLKKKYGVTIAGILAHRDGIKAELERLENAAERSGKIEAELGQAQAALAAVCDRIHRARVKAAKKLEDSLLKELKTLGMSSAEFSVGIEMEEGRYLKTGADAVEFLLAPNPGEPLKPVKSIASGGELSRVMLALKTVLANADKVPIVVFDEVDAGIGGTVARAVGQKLSALARTHQVLCVTHLPQVACFGGAHFGVTKTVSGGRTSAVVERLEGGRRLEIVATMLGGITATSASRKHAKELLESSLT